MNLTIIFIACLLFSASVFLIASSSIGFECGNTTDYKTKKKNNFNALIAFIVMGVLCILSGGASVLIGFRLP